MLIKNSDLYQSGLQDLRIEQGVVTAIGHLTPQPGESVVEAHGGTLIPGLHDHHIHFLSFAASLASIDCSPGAVKDSSALAALLERQAPGADWLRGYGYHESIAGEIDNHWLDRYCPDRPLRIQHRTGRLWIFNSKGIALLKEALRGLTAPPLLPAEAYSSGRFYDADHALGQLLGRRLPPVKPASDLLASFGITGFTDMTPTNDLNTVDLFRRLKSDGAISQNIKLATSTAYMDPEITTIVPGPVKIHLHENRLPPLQQLVDRIHSSHHAGVAVAIHCVTEVELLFSLAALEEAGTLKTDRVEHASVTPEYLIDRILELGVTVVTQPHFILEKGDSYLRDVASEEHDSLYRCRSFLDRQIPIAGSSDAPFGSPDPWAAMRSAIQRQTRIGHALGSKEAVTPEQALHLYLGTLDKPGCPRALEIGMVADLCLLQHPWSVIRQRMTREDVVLVLNKGEPVFKRSQPPHPALSHSVVAQPAH